MAYYVSIVCENCGWTGVIEIVDGELVKSQECPVCKCQHVIKRWGVSADMKDKEVD